MTDSHQKKKRVLHVVTHFDVGGAERVAISIAKSETPDIEYHVVEVMRGNSDVTGRITAELQAAGIAYHRSVMPDIKFHFVFERLAALFFPLWFLPLYLRLRPAALHVHTEVPELSVWWFFTLLPFVRHCRVVRTVHNTRLWTGQQRLGRRVERFYQRLGASVAISQSVRDSYERVYGERLEIIHNGVETTPQKAWHTLRQGCINVLFAGRLEEQKGVKHLAAVLKAMADDERYFFHIVGDGRLRGLVEEAADGCRNVEIHRPVHGLSQYLASFGCLFMPSEFEGLSILSIEASMAGLPVVANDCPGLGDTLPPDWPLKVEGNNHDAYLHLFRNVIPLADMQALGNKAAAFAAEHFGVRRMQELYEARY